MFIEGKTPCTIAKILTEEGIKTPGGKDKWGSTVIESILTNEKYKGSALLKDLTVDFLEKKIKPMKVKSHSTLSSILTMPSYRRRIGSLCRWKSRGENHSAESTAATARSEQGFIQETVEAFTEPRPGTPQTSTKGQSGNAMTSSKANTAAKHLTSMKGMSMRFLAAYNTLIANQDSILEDCRLMMEVLTNCTAIDSEIAELLREAEVITELTKKMHRRECLKRTEPG